MTRPQDLIQVVIGSGFRVILEPRTIFIPWDLPKEDYLKEMIILRDKYGFMIQTEIH